MPVREQCVDAPEHSVGLQACTLACAFVLQAGPTSGARAGRVHEEPRCAPQTQVLTLSNASARAAATRTTRPGVWIQLCAWSRDGTCACIQQPWAWTYANVPPSLPPPPSPAPGMLTEHGTRTHTAGNPAGSPRVLMTARNSARMPSTICCLRRQAAGGYLILRRRGAAEEDCQTNSRTVRTRGSSRGAVSPARRRRRPRRRKNDRRRPSVQPSLSAMIVRTACARSTSATGARCESADSCAHGWGRRAKAPLHSN